MKVEELVEAHVQQMTADGRALNTIQQARRHGLLIARYFGERDMETITHVDIARFLTSAMALRTFDGRLRKPTSANALRSSVRTLFSYANAAGFAPTNAAGLVRRARCGSPLPKALSTDDRERLVATLEQAETDAERRDHALLVLLLTAGLRIGAALNADIEDLDLDACSILLRSAKNGHESVAFMPRETAERVREHVGTRTSGPIFTCANGRRLGSRQAHRRLQRWIERAQLSRRFGLHALRHTFGTELLRRTGNIALVSKAMTHRTLGATLIYAQVGDAQVRAAVGAEAATQHRRW